MPGNVHRGHGEGWGGFEGVMSKLGSYLGMDNTGVEIRYLPARKEGGKHQ